MITEYLKNKLSKIKLLVSDFDGVMTDGLVYVDQNGIESVKCSRKDGLGIAMLKRNNIEVVVISKETNPIVSARCKKLNIKCWQAVEDGDAKLEILKRFISENKLEIEEVAYVGDDLNDVAVLQFVGVAFTVADGHAKAKECAHYITDVNGGCHAIREIAEKILKAKEIALEF